MSKEESGLRIERAFTATDEVRELVDELESELATEYPREQRHGLSIDAIFEPHVRFFVARAGGEPVGCGGVALFEDFAEVKRMFVRSSARGRGAAAALLARLEDETRAAGLAILRLETGDRQVVAMRFYERSGFAVCAAFGGYRGMSAHALATSVFYEKRLTSRVTG